MIDDALAQIDGWHLSQQELLLVAVVAFALLAWLIGRRGLGDEDNRPLRRRRQPWYRRLNSWRRGVGRQPWYWKIGRHVASLEHTHGLTVGGSGSGKSTLVVSLILQPCIGLFMWLMRRLGLWRRRPVLIVSFDRSDPIEQATNVLEDQGVPVERWRVRQANGWDVLQGDVEMIAEALPEGWSKTADDTGFFRQLASDSIAQALTEQDEEGVPRDFADMVERVDRIMAADPEIPDLARRTWVRRLRSLARVMGPSIGADFDLVSALRAGHVVHLSSNSYTNPAITPLVGAMAITHAKLAAEQVSDVYLVLEEAAFLKHRSGVLEDLARSMRARGWRIVYLSQNPNDVGEVLQVNFGVAVFMGLGPLATKAREWCASVVKGFPGAFRAQELVLGATIDQLEGYVLLNGRCRDVSLPPYITGPAEHRPAGRAESAAKWSESPETVGEDDDSEEPDSEPQARSTPTVEQGPVVMPRLYADVNVPAKWQAQLLNIWLHHRFPGGPGGCYESTYHVNNRGRPACSLDGADWTVYVLTRALEDARLRGLDEQGTAAWLSEVRMLTASGQLTVDHACENEICTRVEHLAWESRARNAELYHERKRAPDAAREIASSVHPRLALRLARGHARTRRSR